MKRFFDKVSLTPYGPDGTCKRWIGAKGSNGYGQVLFRGKVQYAHRVAFMLCEDVDLASPRQGGPVVCHRCDVRDCVNRDHLFLGTHQDNVQDMHRKGRWRPRMQNGEANFSAKLSDHQVLAIRQDRRSGEVIASHYGVSAATVSMIRNHKRWTHLKRNEK